MKSLRFLAYSISAPRALVARGPSQKRDVDMIQEEPWRPIEDMESGAAPWPSKLVVVTSLLLFVRVSQGVVGPDGKDLIPDSV